MKIKILILATLFPLTICARDVSLTEDSEFFQNKLQANDSVSVEQIESNESPINAGNEEPSLSNESAENIENKEESDDSSYSENTENSEEMSQEEADAELAAATDSLFADSTASDSILKTLELDMTTAVIPSESRRIASPYGIRTYRMHRGVDLGLCHGEDRTIVAAFAGTVKLIRNQGRRRGYGKYVILDHGNGLTTLYAHLASWQVKVGDELQAGDTIGVGGNTGRSFGAHLHFEMRYHGLYIDPTTVFNFEEGTFLNTVASIDLAALQTTEDEFQKELSKHRYYKVRRGDCLGKIARKYGISVRRLKQLNHLKGDRIRPGQVLKCS
ncbi:MAG: peptidoglycan DD-metalloendopeptidase family protein [Fibrobacter sp.]|nr:peptidoglycan DD-metalloendopeptidase family protein [Fibrobacter sp.]